MKISIADKTLKITDNVGHIQSWNLTYGSVYYDPVFQYVEVKDISDTSVQIRIDNITEYNGVAGTTTYAQIVQDLELNTKA